MRDVRKEIGENDGWKFDTVLFHQVLHYAQEPETVLAEAARVARAGARIAVVDFAAHDREELRERHAHARLGFSDEQMLTLLSESGFAPDAPLALTGNPLTIKIWTAHKPAGAASDETRSRPAPSIQEAHPS